MKTKIMRIVAFLLTFSVILSASVMVSASNSDKTVLPLASSYIASVGASISGSDGTITVSFDIFGTGKMSSIGATKVQIKNSNGTTVKTFYSSSTADMIGYNRISYASSVSYPGTVGQKYYAVVYFKAANSSGSDTTSYTTGYATA